MAVVKVLDVERKSDVAATEVHKVFAEEYDRIIQETGRMSGFVIVAFDDHGVPVSTVHLGEMFPIPPPMLPDIVKQCTISHVF